MQHATSANGSTVHLLELTPPPGRSVTGSNLYIVVMDVVCRRSGKRQHWSRTETKLPDALELYECAVADHVEAV